MLVHQRVGTCLGLSKKNIKRRGTLFCFSGTEMGTFELPRLLGGVRAQEPGRSGLASVGVGGVLFQVVSPEHFGRRHINMGLSKNVGLIFPMIAI